MKLKLKAGTTSKILRVFIQDSSSTTGAGLTGLVYNSASLTAYYSRTGSSSATAITLVTATAGTWTSSGFKELDATNMPGIYELHLPDAVIAAGSTTVHLMLKGATNMVVLPIEIELDLFDYQSATVDVGKWLSTAVSTPTVAGVPNVNAKTWNDLTTVALPLIPTTAGRTLDVSAGGEAGVDWANVGSPTTTLVLSGTTVGVASSVSALAAGVITAASIAADAITDAKVASDVTIAQVTGSVGSVTGNVGGNVVGSVASVVGAVGSVTGLTASNLDTTISSRASATNLATVAGYIDTEIAAIQAKTDLIPASPASTTNITAGTITTVTNLTNAPTSGDLTSTMKASVNAEVLDVLNVDTFAELAGPPAATSSLRGKITWLFMWARNRSTQTATQRKLYADDATTVVSTETVTSDATTYDKGEAS